MHPTTPPPVAAVTVAVVRVGAVEVPLPRYQTPGSAGMDLHAATTEPVTLTPLGRHLFPTGLAMAIPDGYEAQVRPRSGLAAGQGVTVINAPGTIDSDYRGELKVALVNLSQEAVVIAQLVVAPVTRADLTLVDALPATQRGAGGYGSTGS